MEQCEDEMVGVGRNGGKSESEQESGGRKLVGGKRDSLNVVIEEGETGNKLIQRDCEEQKD